MWKWVVLQAHREGLTPRNVQKHAPHMGDIDYVWAAAWGWLVTLIPKSPKT